jgi:probable F420-dependent oxidoreductase
VRFWVPLICLPLDEYAPIADAAERLGYAGVLLADHVAVPRGFESVHPSGENPFTPDSDFPDPVTMIATLAARTRRLKFMTYAYVLPLRDPFNVAKQFGTLAAVTGGRVALGCAVGWLAEEFALVGQDFRTRGARTDESIAILRDFWDDGWAEHRGKFHDFGPAGMFPAPGTKVPILVGGSGRRALERAARSDGWLGMNHDFDEIERILASLNALRAEAGGSESEFTVFVIANAMPEAATHERLSALGVTDTVAAAWTIGSPDAETLDEKIAGLERFAAEHLHS